MKIEIIDDRRFSEIWVDGKKFREIDKSLYRGSLKRILQASSIEELDNLLFRLDREIACKLTYNLLALKGYMKLELEEKLKARKIGHAAAEHVLQECERMGYLNDQREGALFVDRQKAKGWGASMIARKLQRKAPHLADLVQISDEEERAMIDRWIEKKTPKRNFSDIKEKQKLYRFLKNRGFREALICESLFRGCMEAHDEKDIG